MTILRHWITLALLAAAPGSLAGQRLGVGVTGSAMVDGGRNVDAQGCVTRDYYGGAGPTIRLIPKGERLGVSLSARAYRLYKDATCFVDPLPPPPNGTITLEDRYTLQSYRFVTGDARVEYRFLERVQLGAGGGMAWHAGIDFPYGLVSAEVFPILHTAGRVGIGLELYAMRVATDRTRITYANSNPVLVEDLGRERRWSHAVVITLGGSLTVF